MALLNSRRRRLRPNMSIPVLGTKPGKGLMQSINARQSLKGRPSIEGIEGWLRQLGHTVKLQCRRNNGDGH